MVLVSVEYHNKNEAFIAYPYFFISSADDVKTILDNSVETCFEHHPDAWPVCIRVLENHEKDYSEEEVSNSIRKYNRSYMA